MGWLSVVVRVVMSTILLGCMVQGKSFFNQAHGFLGEEDDYFDSDLMASFDNFGQKIIATDNKRSLTRSGRKYPAAAAKDPIKFYAPKPAATGYLPPPPPVEEASASASEPLPLATEATSTTATVTETTQGADADPTMQNMVMDASYAFSFSSEDSSRQESSDAIGNVEGEYGYQTHDGARFKVKYSAGPEKGFVIENQQELEQNLLRLASSTATVDLSDTKTRIAPEVDSAEIYAELPTIDPETWIRSRSYKFGFQSQSGAGRQESADQDGTVTGSYQTLDDQGQPITVHYKAGSGIGFVILNPDQVESGITLESVQPVEPSQPAASVVRADIPAVDYDDYEMYDDQNDYSSTYYEDYEGTVDNNDYDDYYDQDQDRSYEFDFADENGTGRSEVADSKGFVIGSYKYVNQEGNQIRVEYTAGPDIGFVVKNREELEASLEKATLEGGQAAAALASKHQGNKQVTDNNSSSRRVVIRKKPRRIPGQVGSSHHYQVAAANVELQSAVASTNNVGLTGSNGHNEEQSGAAGVVEMGNGNEYSFSFSSDELNHQEVSSAEGERLGSYSYVNPLGEVVLVKYRAGVNGFEILN